MKTLRCRRAGMIVAAIALLPAFRADAQTQGPTKPPKSKSRDKAVFAVGPNATTRYAVDTTSKRNQVSFTSRTVAETFKGTTKTIQGELELNPKQLDSATGRFSVAWKDLDTKSRGRNEHMLSSPWVDAGSHPDIVLTVTGIEDVKPKGKDRKTISATLVGKFALNGVEKDVRIKSTLAYVAPRKGMKNDEKIKEGIGIKSHFKVALEDYNIEGRGVGQKVAAEQQISVTVFLARVDSDPKTQDTAVKPEKGTRTRKS